MSTTYGLVILTILCIWVCYSVAKQRRTNVRFWVVMGAIFGPLAIPFVFFSKPNPPVYK